jgi:hypothetical protein
MEKQKSPVSVQKTSCTRETKKTFNYVRLWLLIVLTVFLFGSFSFLSACKDPPEEKEFTLTFNYGEGVSVPAAFPTSMTVRERFRFSADDFPEYNFPEVRRRTGYTFNGWWSLPNGAGTRYTHLAEEEDGDVPEFTFSHNSTAYIHWIVNDYTLSFNISGTPNDLWHEKTRQVFFDSVLGELPVPDRTDFWGWFASIDGVETRFTEETVFRIPRSLTLYARFDVTHLLMLDFDDGVTQSEEFRFIPGREIEHDTFPYNPLRRGHNFLGWQNEKTGDLYFGSGSIPTFLDYEDVRLIAQWELAEYGITLNYQNIETGLFEGNHIHPNQILIRYGELFNLPNPQESSFRRFGHDFAGWWTLPNGLGRQFVHGTPYTLPASEPLPASIGLFAHWTPMERTITLNYMDGRTTGPFTVSVTYGDEIGSGLPLEPLREHFRFGGWWFRGGRGVCPEGNDIDACIVCRTHGQTPQIFTPDIVFEFEHNITLQALWFGSEGLSFERRFTPLGGFNDYFVVSVDREFDGTFGAVIAIPDFWEDLPVVAVASEGFNFSELQSAGINLSHLTGIILPRNVREIGQYAFAGLPSLTTIDLSSVHLIRTGAFMNCTALVNITNISSLTGAGAMAFRNTGLVSITIPNGIIDLDVSEDDDEGRINPEFGRVKIANGMFEGNRNLTTVVMPANLVQIGASAFADCVLLTVTAFPASLRFIGDNAFSGCSALTGERLLENSSVEEIGASAFRNTGLSTATNLYLPSVLRFVGEHAFSGSIEIEGSEPDSTVTIGTGPQNVHINIVLVDCLPECFPTDCLSGCEPECETDCDIRHYCLPECFPPPCQTECLPECEADNCVPHCTTDLCLPGCGFSECVPHCTPEKCLPHCVLPAVHRQLTMFSTSFGTNANLRFFVPEGNRHVYIDIFGSMFPGRFDPPLSSTD